MLSLIIKFTLWTIDETFVDKHNIVILIVVFFRTEIRSKINEIKLNMTVLNILKEENDTLRREIKQLTKKTNGTNPALVF